MMIINDNDKHFENFDMLMENKDSANCSFSRRHFYKLLYRYARKVFMFVRVKSGKLIY